MLIILSKSPMMEGAQVVDDLQISSLVSGKQTTQEPFCQWRAQPAMFQLFCEVVRKELDLHTSDTLSHNMITAIRRKGEIYVESKKTSSIKKVRSECTCRMYVCKHVQTHGTGAC